jgi:putative ABC transport system substrate-binding protein
VRRREFLGVLGGAVWPIAARAQFSGKTYRIGFLGVHSHSEYQRLVDALRIGLRQLGYEEGKSITIEYRWAEGRYERLPQLAAELVRLNVDLLVTHTSLGAQAAKQATSTLPIVFAAVADPIEAGLVLSLARPGGNLTGLTFFATEISAKRVELIKEAIPAMSRLAVLFNAAIPLMATILNGVQRAASELGLELVRKAVKERDDIPAAIAAVAAGHAEALVVIEEPLTISNARQIADLTLQHGLPMIGFPPQAEAGALMQYGADLVDLYSRSAAFVDRILRGTPPADLPIERAVKFDLVLNLNSAKALGIELPTALLIRANRVIE